MCLPGFAPLNGWCTLPGICGDSILNSGEECDGTQLNGQSCTSLGLPNGTLACTPECTYETAGCDGTSVWTCPEPYYGTNDGCDCGCGIIDPDCPNPTSSVCVYCND